MVIDPGRRDDEQKKKKKDLISLRSRIRISAAPPSPRLRGRRCPEDATAAAGRFSYTAEVPAPSGIDLEAHQFSHFLHPV